MWAAVALRGITKKMKVVAAQRMVIILEDDHHPWSSSLRA
jgi:hypothetical protein